MPYTTPDKVQTVFENTQDLDNDERDQVKKIEKEIVQAEINTELSDEYDPPFKDHPDTPSAITMIATLFTANYFIVFPGSGGSDNFDFAEELYDRAKNLLQRLADGDITLHDANQQLDDNNFTFDGAKSEAFYDQSIFIGNEAGPSNFGDSDSLLDDSSTIDSA